MTPDNLSARAIVAGFAVVVASVAVARRALAFDEDKPKAIATTDHVLLEAVGLRVAGWPIDESAKDGTVLLRDDGEFTVVPREPPPKVLARVASPVTDLPGAALVIGLSHVEEGARDRCKDLLAEVLAARGAELVPLLRDALASPAVETRRRTLEILVHAPLAELAADVRTVTADSDERVRKTALVAYGALRREDFLELCVTRLRFDRSALVRHAAMVELGGLGDLRGVDPLLDQLVGCDDHATRVVVFNALRKITGQNLGRDEDAWRAWWTNHREEVLASRGR
jgi:hypothetical protein